jgi:hypothetical protein
MDSMDQIRRMKPCVLFSSDAQCMDGLTWCRLCQFLEWQHVSSNDLVMNPSCMHMGRTAGLRHRGTYNAARGTYNSLHWIGLESIEAYAKCY